MQDIEIITLINNGDKNGLVEFKKKYHNLILKTIKSILKDEEDINGSIDLTYKRIKAFGSLEYLRAFTVKCAREVSLNIYNEKYKDPINELDYDLVTDFTMDDVIFLNALLTRLNVFFDKLGLRDLIFFIRRYFFNEDIESIAKQFELKKSEVSDRLKKLQLFLKSF